MIQAAINPETGEFIGLIVPRADLADGQRVTFTLFGDPSSWEALLRGEEVDQSKVGVIIISGGEPYAPTLDSLDKFAVDNLSAATKEPT